MRFRVRTLRLVAWPALACHLLVASGVPVPLARAPVTGGRDTPTRLAAKDRSRPFPCMDKPCGCATADQCYASCCCHAPGERLAWARAHAVEPAVLAALERRVAHDAGVTGGCRTERDRQGCSHRGADPAVDLDGPDVCRDYQSLAADPAVHDEASRDTAPRTVILRDMLSCGGIAAGWLACGACLPPPARVVIAATRAAVGTIVLGDDTAPARAADLASPPPRIA